MLSAQPVHCNQIMAWRNQGITGSNNVPLGGARRRFEDQEEDSRTATPVSSGAENGFKRGRSPLRGELFFFFFVTIY